MRLLKSQCISSIPMYAHMDDVMSKHGIVTGDMGDELLGGYPFLSKS